MPRKSSVSRKKGASKLRQQLELGTFKGMLAWGMLVAQRASDKAPVASGRLARSITQGVPFVISPSVWGILVGTNVEYARAQELGSGLYSEDPNYMRFIEITAVNAKALAFEWPGGPKNSSAYDSETGLFFFKKVNHPGVRPQPFLRPAMDESRDDGAKLVVSAIAAEMRKP